MTSVVLLLRGINLGRNRRVSMADLRALIEGLGYAEVRTVLQSGNVVLDATEPPQDVALATERQIADRLGIEVAVMARTGGEIREVLAADPLGDVATDGSRSFVAFLSGEPDAAGVRELEETELAPERLVARGREIYMWCPGGAQHSAATRLLTPRRLGVQATVRNWNTVTKLAALVA